MNTDAVKIIDMLESSRVKVFSFPEDISFERQEYCPACISKLKPICALISGNQNQKMEFGLCRNCGYMGYIDRPPKEWMIRFYSEKWDRAFPKTDDDIKKGTILPGKGVKPSRYLAASIIEKLDVEKEKGVCDIGSGYGEVLKYFKEQRFKKLIGVENSKHRAESVSRALGFKILHGEFENDKIQKDLSKIKPIGLFFSHHVLEHVYNPAELVGKISSFQESGDYLILSLPNALGEHINYALLYLMHLHSFTKESLEALLNKYGYEMVLDNSPDETNIVIAARKTSSPKRRFSPMTVDYLSRVLDRVRAGLLSKPAGGLKELHWRQSEKRDYSETLPVSRFIPKLTWEAKKAFAFIKTRLGRFSSGHTMLVSEAKNSGHYPFEIYFNKDMKLLIK